MEFNQPQAQLRNFAITLHQLAMIVSLVVVVALCLLSALLLMDTLRVQESAPVQEVSESRIARAGALVFVVGHPTLKAKDEPYRVAVSELTANLQAITYSGKEQCGPAFGRVNLVDSVPGEVQRVAATLPGDKSENLARYTAAKYLIDEFQTSHKGFTVMVLTEQA